MQVPSPYQEEEEARHVLRNRTPELRRWVDKIQQHLDDGSLYELEADLQVLGMMANISAEQVLRVITLTSELRDAGGRGSMDEVAEQRDSHGRVDS